MKNGNLSSNGNYLQLIESVNIKKVNSVAQKLEALNRIAGIVLKEVEAIKSREFAADDGEINFFDEVKRFEIELILSALNQTGGRQKEAAKILGLKPTTLSEKIKRYGIDYAPDAAAAA